MEDRALVTPSVIKWSRETARMTVETAAASLQVSPERLLAWERGEKQPTIHQAEHLAHIYQRPFALLFLPKPPYDFTPLDDFRRKNARPLGTASTFIIREVRQKQAWMHEFLQDAGEPDLPFVGRFTIRNSPANVAADMRREIGIDPTHYTETNPIKEWIAKAETKGIFITRTSNIHSYMKLDSDELQGFAIANPLAPFIFINTEDWNAAQLFTLVHELAHIWINQTGVSSDIALEKIGRSGRNPLHPVELFCNQVAAEALLPEAMMRALDNDMFKSAKSIYAAAAKHGVSTFAFLYRALTLHLIAASQYRSLKRQAEEQYQAFVKKQDEKAANRKVSFADPYRTRVNRNGQLFTRTVIDAYRGGAIAPNEASQLLSTPVNKFSKLEEFV